MNNPKGHVESDPYVGLRVLCHQVIAPNQRSIRTDSATGKTLIDAVVKAPVFVMVAHEALIRGWQRLRNWVDQDREFLRTRERIAAQARLWDDEGKPPDRLLPSGRPLAEGEDLLATRRADLDPLLVDYGDFAAKRHPFAKDSRCPLRRTAADELILSSWFTESN